MGLGHRVRQDERIIVLSIVKHPKTFVSKNRRTSPETKSHSGKLEWPDGDVSVMVVSASRSRDCGDVRTTQACHTAAGTFKIHQLTRFKRAFWNAREAVYR